LIVEYIVFEVVVEPLVLALVVLALVVLALVVLALVVLALVLVLAHVELVIEHVPELWRRLPSSSFLLQCDPPHLLKPSPVLAPDVH